MTTYCYHTKIFSWKRHVIRTSTMLKKKNNVKNKYCCECNQSHKHESLDIENNSSDFKSRVKNLGEILGRLPSILVEMGSPPPAWPWSRAGPRTPEFVRRLSFIPDAYTLERGRNSKFGLFNHTTILGEGKIVVIMSVLVL